MTGVISGFFRLGKEGRRLHREALVGLLMARLRMLVQAYPKVRAHLDHVQGEPPDHEHQSEICEIGRVIRRVARNLPFECRCMVQALAAHRMLRRRGWLTTIFIGVKKDAPAELASHAWLQCGNWIVTGGDERHGYVVIETLGFQPM